MTPAFLLALALSMARGVASVPRDVVPPPPVRPAASAPPPVLSAEAEEEVSIAKLAAWRGDPVRFVREVFRAEPDAWQAKALRALLTDQRIAMSACKGPGKTTELAWSGWWILTCFVDAQGFALSITADNLRDNLWKELAVWYAKSEPLQVAFSLNSDRIAARERPKTWFLSARSFPQQADASQQANTLAGLHGPVVFVLLDEVGDYPVGVLAASKGVFAVKGQRGWVLAAGNPTTVGGGLHYIVTTDASSWRVVFITGDPDDPDRSPRIDIDWAREEIRKLGRDNPWVMVNILGKFPPAGSDQLISVNDVIAAMARELPALGISDAIVWGLDPARFGDDEAVLAQRQGVGMKPVITWRNLDGTDLGDQVARLLLEAEQHGELPDALFVDVGGVGASAYDRLRYLGWKDVVRPVDFGGSPAAAQFLNKRVEMWWNLNDWLKTMPASLPEDMVLQGELTAPRFWFRVVQKRTVFVLEPKEELKKRGVPSPNRADALALTFAAPVAPRARSIAAAAHRQQTHVTEYDPLARG